MLEYDLSSSPFCLHHVAYVSRTIELNDITFSRVVKMSFSIKFQNFGPIALNLHNINFMTSHEINQ